MDNTLEEKLERLKRRARFFQLSLLPLIVLLFVLAALKIEENDVIDWIGFALILFIPVSFLLCIYYAIKIRGLLRLIPQPSVGEEEHTPDPEIIFQMAKAKIVASLHRNI